MEKNRNCLGSKLLSGTLLSFAMLLIVSMVMLEVEAQTNRTSRATPRPTPTPRVLSSEAIIVSRAEDFENTSQQRADDPERVDITRADPADRTIESLENRIRALESNKSKDPDAVHRRLMLNLDILTRAEQRADALRKQMFDMFEKETSILAKLDVLEIEGRQDMIERSVATMGSLRPEELREAKRKQVEAEKANLQRLLGEIQRNRGMIETSVQKADELVDRIRLRLEKEIDEALDGETSDQP